jgi:hypothetical protein
MTNASNLLSTPTLWATGSYRLIDVICPLQLPLHSIKGMGHPTEAKARPQTKEGRSFTIRPGRAGM